MEPYYQDDSVVLIHGDCLDVLRELPDASVHAVVTDPPYALEFMGRGWDKFTPLEFEQWCETWATECLRVLKPGGHLLAFGGSRTWHRLTAGIEDAGFEIRDSIAWLYGSGFPKSLDVSKAIDKAAGAERETKGWLTRDRVGVFAGDGGDTTATSGNLQCPDCLKWKFAPDYCKCPRDNGAQTPDAERWQGWGTALKPAFEPVVVARKPLSGTVAANVLAHGTGAINVGACRVGTTVETWPKSRSFASGISPGYTDGIARGDTQQTGTPPAGRWPANVILDEHAAAELDRQSGTLTSGKMLAGTRPKGERTTFGRDVAGGYETTRDTPGDSGGASRFFPVFKYEPKAPTTERPRDGSTAHPTVKPLDLMRWLVRLVAPPGGTVLDPFAGSGTTAEACIIEGFPCIVIEREPDYLPLIVQRVTKPIAPVLDLGSLA